MAKAIVRDENDLISKQRLIATGYRAAKSGRFVRVNPELAALAQVSERLESVVLYGQPEHIASAVWTACTEGDCVIDLEAWTDSTAQASARAGII
ncbi:MAG: hypothetical protein V4451_16185 [Pseudomonadota bacterium]